MFCVTQLILNENIFIMSNLDRKFQILSATCWHQFSCDIIAILQIILQMAADSSLPPFLDESPASEQLIMIIGQIIMCYITNIRYIIEYKLKQMYKKRMLTLRTPL